LIGKALWLTGLPGSGKTSIAKALKKANPEMILLRMDEMRRIVTPNPTYSENEREILYRSLVYTAKSLQNQGIL